MLYPSPLQQASQGMEQQEACRQDVVPLPAEAGQKACRQDAIAMHQSMGRWARF